MTGQLDQFGRRIEYLRVSVTDKCNFRCLYCMPPEGLQWLPKADLLSYEEISGIVDVLSMQGLTRIRLTGGEPTIRADLHILIEKLRANSAIEDISLSTNGVRLGELARLYADAGLNRVNISADSLRPDRIAAISRRATGFSPVEAAVAAEKAGLSPIKINVVVMRGINDDEIVDFARLTLDHPWHIRFIELMPVGDMREVTWGHVVPAAEVLDRITALGTISPVDAPDRSNGPATYYRLEDAAGSVGVISPMTHTYCGSCNRVRLTADGRLRTCLFGDHEVNLRDAYRAGADLRPLFKQALASKPLEHELLQMRNGGLRALSQVGG